MHGSVSVERQFSKPDELGSGAAAGPWEWSIFGKMAASKPRRVGLHEVASMAWSGVLGAGTPAKSMGAGRAKSPASGFQGAAIRPLIHGSVQVERDFSKPCE